MGYISFIDDFFSHIAYPSEKIGYNKRHDIFRVHHSGNSNKVIGSWFAEYKKVFLFLFSE